MNTQTPTALQRAVDQAAGVANLAQACGVSEQAVYKWLKKGYPPVERCAAVELAVNGAVSRFELLPPAFGVAAGEPAAKVPTIPPPS